MNLFHKYLPITDWLPKYNWDTFRSDLPAGINVGIVLIPQVIAYAIIADIPPIYGLYTALIPQLIYAIFGTSRQLSVGPVAMDSLIVAAGISAIATAGTENYILMATLLAFMMGCIQFLFGVFRLGFLVNFLSKPVISGFTSAAAIIIGLNQIQHLTGASIERSNKIQELILNIFNQLSSINLLSCLIGSGALILILFFHYKKIKFPSALIVVTIGIGIVYFFQLNNNGIKIVETIPSGLPSFKIPSINLENIKQLGYLSLTLALIAFMEAISFAKAIEDKKRSSHVQPNQELVAIGLSNIVGSFFQTYPATGGFSRTAINEHAGAKTAMSSIISAIIIGITLLYLTDLFYYLPKTILAAIIIGAVIRLVDFRYPIELIRYKIDDFIMLILTFIVTLSVGISEGIIIGVLISIIFLIFRSTKPHIAECVQVDGSNQYRNKKRFENINDRKDVLIFRFDGQLYFANSQYFKDQLKLMKQDKGVELKYIILNSECINHIDSSAINMLRQTISELKEDNIKFIFSGTIGPVRDIIFKSKLIDVIDKKMMFSRVEKAMYFIDNEINLNENVDNKIATQVNN